MTPVFRGGRPGATDHGGGERSEALLDRLRRGDAEAMASVYDQHHRVVRAIAQRMLGEPDVAEDLVHDVFFRLPKSIGGFRGDSSLRNFLVGMVVHCSRRHIRSAVRRRSALARLALEPKATSFDPEGSARQKEVATLLTHALAQLPAAQRDAFVLREVQEHSSSEAAAILGIPEGTVRTRVFYAKRRLRELLEAPPASEPLRGLGIACESAA